MRLYGLDEAVRRFERPVFGTCAGMIVLDRNHLGLVDVEVRRNAFGRQVSSFETDLDIAGRTSLSARVFIRAPWIEDVGPEVEVLAEVDGHPVLARQGRISSRRSTGADRRHALARVVPRTVREELCVRA